METFTLFVILPSQEVCSLRHLRSGVTVREIRNRLEMAGGLPSQTYRLLGTDEKIFHEEQDLVLGKNAWDGFMLRAQLLDSWQPIYDAVVRDNIAWILENGAVHLKDYTYTGDGANSDDEDGKGKEDENVRRVIGERGGVALYLACWFGKDKLCRTLMDVGVDPNGRTPCRRTPIFACVAQGNDRVLEIMVIRGAHLSAKDFHGDTAMDVAKRNFARQCVNRIRSLQLMQRNRPSSRCNSPSSSYSEIPRTPRSDDVNQRLDSSLIASRIKSGRAQSARISVTENAAVVNNERFPVRRGKMKEDTSSPHSSRAHQYQLSPRGIFSGTPNSPRHSSTTSGSPRFKGALFDRGSKPARASSGIQFRLAVPLTNSMSKSPNRSKHVVTWDCSLTGTDLLSVNLSQTTQTTNQDSDQVNGHAQPFRQGTVTEHSSSFNTSLSSPRTSRMEEGQMTSTDAQSVESHSTVNVPVDVTAAREAIGSRNTSTRASTRSRRQLLKSSQKKNETMSTARRRIQLSEQMKLDAKKRQTFEQWLKRKRIQQRRDQSKYGTDDSSSEDDTGSNPEAFRNWLKELKERPIHKPNPNSAVSLHHRKTRALPGLIEIGDTTPPENKVFVDADVSSYMHSYKDWQKKKKRAKQIEDGSKIDAENAKKTLENKRLELLAMAVSFDEWMAHTEEKKKLTKVIDKADKTRGDDTDHNKITNQNKNQLSFSQWKQRVDEKEARQRLKKLRIRQQGELDKDMRNSQRNSASVPHDEWLRRKFRDDQLQQQLQQERQRQQQQSKSASGMHGSPERTFSTWVKSKQDQEMNQLDSGIRKERHLLLQLREKKHVTISTC